MFLHATLGYIIWPAEVAQGDSHDFELFTLTFKFFLLILYF